MVTGEHGNFSNRTRSSFGGRNDRRTRITRPGFAGRQDRSGRRCLRRTSVARAPANRSPTSSPPTARSRTPSAPSVRTTRDEIVEFYNVIANMDTRTTVLNWKKIAGDTAVFEFVLHHRHRRHELRDHPVDIMVFDAGARSPPCEPSGNPRTSNNSGAERLPPAKGPATRQNPFVARYGFSPTQLGSSCLPLRGNDLGTMTSAAPSCIRTCGAGTPRSSRSLAPLSVERAVTEMDTLLSAQWDQRDDPAHRVRERQGRLLPRPARWECARLAACAPAGPGLPPASPSRPCTLLSPSPASSTMPDATAAPPRHRE